MRDLEDIYEQVTSQQALSEENRASELKKKEFERVGAEKIRKAAMGEFYSKEMEEDIDHSSIEIINEDKVDESYVVEVDDKLDDKANEENKAAHARDKKHADKAIVTKKKKAIEDNKLATLSKRARLGFDFQGFENLMEIRNETKHLNMSIKKKQIQNVETKLRLEEAKLQLEAKKFESEREERQASMALMQSMVQSLGHFRQQSTGASFDNGRARKKKTNQK